MASQEEFERKLNEITEGLPEGGELNGDAVAMSEFYASFIRAEFSPPQALYLTAAIATGNPGMPPNRS